MFGFQHSGARFAAVGDIISILSRLQFVADVRLSHWPVAYCDILIPDDFPSCKF